MDVLFTCVRVHMPDYDSDICVEYIYSTFLSCMLPCKDVLYTCVRTYMPDYDSDICMEYNYSAFLSTKVVKARSENFATLPKRCGSGFWLV
jgi:hypothetical protein